MESFEGINIVIELYPYETKENFCFAEFDILNDNIKNSVSFHSTSNCFMELGYRNYLKQKVAKFQTRFKLEANSLIIKSASSFPQFAFI